MPSTPYGDASGDIAQPPPRLQYAPIPMMVLIAVGIGLLLHVVCIEVHTHLFLLLYALLTTTVDPTSCTRLPCPRPPSFLQESDAAWFLAPVYWLAYALFRTHLALRVLLGLALAAHIIEALIAARLAVHLRCRRSHFAFWVVQTLLFGYPSLQYLVAESRKRSRSKSA